VHDADTTTTTTTQAPTTAPPGESRDLSLDERNCIGRDLFCLDQD